ncbi:1-pyrroline-5-carboxylate dehydrogenase [Hypoxylon texense]
MTRRAVGAHVDLKGGCHIFDEPCEKYDNLVAILRRPDFKRLDLDLLVGWQEHEGWLSFRHGLIYRALGEIAALEHVSMRTNVIPDPDSQASQRGSGGSIQHHIPLLSIFPTDKWSQLRHFGLSGFLVQQADVLSLLASLPWTIRTDDRGSYRYLLVDMHDTLDWSHRAEDARPKVTIGIHPPEQYAGQAIWVDREVYDFLYRDDENPFGYNGHSLNQVPQGKGTVRDAFDPAYERPWTYKLKNPGVPFGDDPGSRRLRFKENGCPAPPLGGRQNPYG